jgi:hypothetical protein
MVESGVGWELVDKGGRIGVGAQRQRGEVIIGAQTPSSSEFHAEMQFSSSL